MKTIAVVGAGGRLGRVVAKTFFQRGYNVIAVTRSGKLPRELSGAVARKADAMQLDALVEATAGAEFVFNGLNPPYTDWSANCMPMARNVIEAARTHGATHLFPGNVYVFGSPMPGELRETTPFAASSKKGTIRVSMERLFEQAAREQAVQTIVLRAGDFFGGAGTGSWFDLSVAAKIGKGTFTWPGTPDIRHEWAYLPDLAKTFVALANRSEKLGRHETFHFPGHAITGFEMKKAAEAAFGHPLKLAGLPWWLVRAGGVVIPMWRELTEMAYLWQEPHWLTSQRLESVIGDVPHTPLDEAVAAALGELGFGQGAHARAA